MQRTGRAILVQVAIFVVIVAAAAIAVSFWYQGQYYVSSQDAQVTAPMAPVGSLVTGTLSNWKVNVGTAVSSGEIMGAVVPAATAAPRAAAAGSGAATAPASVAIVAPFAGTVVENQAVAGETVTPGEALAYVADLRATTITAYIKETAIRNIAAGQRVDVTIDAFPGTKFVGQVENVGLATASTFSLLPTSTQSGSFTKVTQRIPVVITLDGTIAGLVPGESASVRIHIR